jgi:Uma2 family endonuclease
VPTANYFGSHPQEALLVIEVAFSSIRRDRLVKPRIYAAAGIPEYWIVDLTTDSVTVLRYPISAGYTAAEEYGRGQRIRLHALPEVVLAVDLFLPPPT